MVKDTQKIRWRLLANCLSVFEYFVGFALKGLTLFDSWLFHDEHIFEVLKTIQGAVSNFRPNILEIL